MIFRPYTRTGLMVHLVLTVALVSMAALCIVLALQEASGTTFFTLLLMGLLLASPLPLVAYRMAAMLRASYAIGREGLRLRWGLRAEDIPLPEVEWARPASDLPYELPLPFLRLPGAVLGTRQHPDLGKIEFLASEAHNLLLVATPQTIYAISPADAGAFLQALRNALEMGSPSPLPSYSAVPGTFLRRVWNDLPARVVILLSLALTAGLWLAALLVVPGRGEISLGFDAAGQPIPAGPAERLFLLPVLGLFLVAVDVIAGLFFYRQEEKRPLAFLFWAGGPITPALLLLAVLGG